MKRSADTRNLRAGSTKKQATGAKSAETKVAKPAATRQSRPGTKAPGQPKGILKIRGQEKKPSDKKTARGGKKDSDDDDLGDDEGGSDAASDDEVDESSAEGSDDDDDLEGVTSAQKNKAPKKATEESMAETMSKILGATLRKVDADTPILAKSRGVERKLEEERVEAKARKALASERKRLEHKDRVKPDYTGMEYEKKLRKVATRGVVQLFNAIKAQQKAGEDMPGRGLGASANAKENVASMTKTSFLDLLKAGSKVAAV